MKCPENKKSQQAGQGKENYIDISEDEIIREEPVEYCILGKAEGKMTVTTRHRVLQNHDLVPVEKMNERISM